MPVPCNINLPEQSLLVGSLQASKVTILGQVCSLFCSVNKKPWLLFSELKKHISVVSTDASVGAFVAVEDLLSLWSALPVFSSFVYQKLVFLHLMNCFVFFFLTLVKVWLVLTSWLKWRNFILGRNTQTCSLLLIKYVFILLSQEVKMHSMVIFFLRILYSF